VAGISQASAKGKIDGSDKHINTFNKDFSNAKNVSWQHEKNYSKVTFSINEKVMYAYYSDESGELLAVSRNILSDQLPITLMTKLESDYNGFWISNLFEMSAQGQTSYYATLENPNEILVLRSNGFTEWHVYIKEKKQ
ncbi:MAG TPA: hypothetical protein VFV08_16235, partial [Puia sp.]|nr:hypothetical protein [Puia sp.]